MTEGGGGNLICRYYWSVNNILSTAKKKYIQEPSLKTDARNRTWAVCVRVGYRSLHTIADFFMDLLIIISNNIAEY